MHKINNQKTEDLSDDELKRLLKDIEENKDIQIGNMMKLALFTGMRRGSLFKLRWEDIDFEHAVIKLRDTKSGQDEYIPMNEKALTPHRHQAHPCVHVQTDWSDGQPGNRRGPLHRAN